MRTEPPLTLPGYEGKPEAPSNQPAGVRKREWAVCCDFDGTICIPDSLDFLLGRFADPEWKELDRAVWGGRLTERVALERQVSLLRATWAEALGALMEGVRIRAGFKQFVSWARAAGIPLTILSSGLREVILSVLQRGEVSDLPVISHRVRIDGDRWRLIPWQGQRLAEHCSHCKCAHVVERQRDGFRVVYVGDGYTDLCPVQHADLVFATGTLAEECERQGRPYLPFETFGDVERELDRLLTTEQGSLS